MRRLKSLSVQLAFLTLAGFAAPAAAREVRVPIELDAELVRGAFLGQVFNGADQKARVWDDGSGCNFLTLDVPDVAIHDDRVYVTSPARARVGTLVLGKCLSVLDWDGFVEVVEQPELQPGTAVFGFKVVDSNLYGPKHQKQVASGVVWNWVKDYVHPRLSTVTIDLGGPLADVRSFLPLVLPNENVARVEAILDSVRLVDLRVPNDKVAADLRIDVPPRPEDELPPVTPSPEPTLTAEELEVWQSLFSPWDAFLTFIIKQAGSHATGSDLRTELFTVLLEGRYDLIEALAPTEPHDKDPVRELFLASWARLAPVMRQVGNGLPPDAALRYLGFITATDALAALDQLGPDLNLEISSDGLRRLARIVAPNADDPLAFNFDVDPDLRNLGGFGPPLEPPPPNPDVDTSSGIVPEILRWLVPSAWAAYDPAALTRLNRWVPTRDELDDYLPLVRDLLKETSAQALARSDLDPQFKPLYRNLIFATAWKESCWRQFIRVGAAIKPITSSVGAVGMMQVNQRVWRGLYDVQGLRGDIAYNAKAGAEIAMHYLVDYALKKNEHKTGNLENAARATYCIYNGGPGAMKRYRNPKASREGKRIDEGFWEKYRAVRDGGEMDVRNCWG